jgi:hypothetical protein
MKRFFVFGPGLGDCSLLKLSSAQNTLGAASNSMTISVRNFVFIASVLR